MLVSSTSLLLAMTVVVEVTAVIDFRTIMEYVNDNSELSTLQGLLQSSKVDTVLEGPGAISTLFAPTNTAFSRLPPQLLQQLQQDPPLLQKTLLSHVVDSAFISLFLTNDHLENTLSGIPLRFNVYNRTYTAEGCPITDGDIVLRNGIVHVIDGVILPAEGDILHQILSDDAEFEDLTAALAVTNLLDDLEFEAITVFAPLNTAFQAYYQGKLPDSGNTDAVKDLLLNHVVNGTYYPVGINDGDTLTSFSGHILNFSKTPSGVLSVNGHRTDGVIYATNGVIHVMTAVLDP